MEETFTSEEEFLKAYNPYDFDLLALTVDILLFSVSDGQKENYRKLNQKYFSVLLVKRKNYPFKDKWCLPGGFINKDENAEEAVNRIITKETNLHDIYMEQLYTFSGVNRDPRMRVISTSYMSLVDKDMLTEELSNKAVWFNINVKENSDTKVVIGLESEDEKFEIELEKHIVSKKTGRCEYKVIKNDNLAFDHALVIATGIERLRNKIEYTDIVFDMMPKTFTLTDLQLVYEAILGRKLLAPAFRRIIAEKVEKTGDIKKGEGHRPSVLFKYKNK